MWTIHQIMRVLLNRSWLMKAARVKPDQPTNLQSDQNICWSLTKCMDLEESNGLCTSTHQLEYPDNYSFYFFMKTYFKVLISSVSARHFWGVIHKHICFRRNIVMIFGLKKKKKHLICRYPLTLVLLNSDISCLYKQCRSRSVGFWRSQLIWIYTVCH